MKTNSVIVRSLFSIPQCWLYEDKQYFYMESCQIGDRLPTIPTKYESILTENGIPFRHFSDSTLEYWDPECYEEIPMTLPVYIPFEGGYRRLKNYTGNVITTDTQEKAIAVQDEIVLPAIRAFEEKQKEEQLRQERQQEQEALVPLLVEALNGRPAIGLTYELYNLPYWLDEKTNFVHNGKSLMFVPVCTFGIKYGEELYYLSDRYAIFDMKNLPSDGILELPVPAGSEGLFIGRGGWQVKKWCEMLGLKRINVVTAK